MTLFKKLDETKGVSVLHGVTIRYRGTNDDPRVFTVVPAELARATRPRDYVLLALHYCTHVLARYPRTDSRLDRFGMELRQLISYIIDQGVWPGSDLFEYSGTDDRAALADVGPDEGEVINAVLMRSVEADDIDLALEVPEGAEEKTLVLSVVALLQAVTNDSPEPEIELLDKALRYLRTYVGEGADYGSPAAARNLANRSFREAGGERT